MLLFHLDPNPSVREWFASIVSLLTGVDLRQFATVAACLDAAQSHQTIDIFFCPLTLDEVSAITARDALLTLHPHTRSVFLTLSTDPQIDTIESTPCIPISDRNTILGLIAGYPIQLPEPPPLFQPGAKLDDYTLQKRLHSDHTKEIYQGYQRTTNRLASIHILKPEGTIDPEILRSFRALVRARASASHKNLTVIYDASDSGNHVYYTAEILSENTLNHAEPKSLTEKNLAYIVEAASQAGTYLQQNQLICLPWNAEDIAFDPTSQTLKLANKIIPASPSTPTVLETDSIVALGKTLEKFSGRSRFGAVINQLANGLFTSWEEVAEITREHLHRIQNQSSLTRVEFTLLPPAERKKRNLLSLTLITILIAAIGVSIYNIRPKTTKLTVTPSQIFFRGGQLSSDLSNSEYVKAFYLDANETPIGEYANFLDALRTTPTTKFDHPAQPKTKTTHTPKNWDTIYPAARDGKTYQEQKLSLNDPIVFVDFWDAWAYAAWKGRRLPTEAEWTRAAQGENSDPLPWTSSPTPLPGYANLGGDYQPKGGGGLTDGYNYWAPVDIGEKDKTPKGLRNMLGNVEEWTATLAEDPTFAGQFTAVVRGGNFTSPQHTDLTARKPSVKTEDAQAWRGFRTASDTAE